MINSIKGLLRIVKFDKSFPVFFDKTPQGFWQSALPAVLYMPLYLYLLISVYTTMGLFDKGVTLPFVLVIEAIAYVITWMVFPLIAYSIMKSKHKTDKFFQVMVPYKWIDGLQLFYGGIIFLFVMSGMLPMALLQSIAVVINISLIANKYFVVRNTYAPTIPAAAGFIFIEGISIILVRMAVGMVFGAYIT